MTYRVRFTEEAEDDLIRLYEFVLTRDEPDWALAECALETIRHGIRNLELAPFCFRRVTPNNLFFRGIVIPFDASGYVAVRNRQRRNRHYSRGQASAGG